MNLNRLNKKQLLLLLVFSLLAVQAVAALNVLEDAFAPFSGLSPDFYVNQWWWIDLLAYSFLFISIGQFALKGKMGDEKGRLGIIVGAILAGSMLVFELRTGFRLANLTPLALFLISFVIGALAYHFARGMGAGKIPAFSAGYFSAFVLTGLLADEIKTSLTEMAKANPSASILLGAMNILFIVALIGLIWSVISTIRHTFSGGFMGQGLGGTGLGEKAGDLAEKAAEKIHEKFGRVEEAEAGQIANVEQYESRLDEFARRLGKGEIKDEQQFKNALQNAIQLAEEAERVEMELETIMQQVQAGQYGDKTREQVDDLRKKYSGHVNSVFKRVQAAEKFARMERQQLLTELKELLAASQADQRVRAMVGNLSMVLGNDRQRFIRDHNLTGKVKADIELLDATIKQFQQLEQQKAQVLRPAEQELKRLEDATNTEINDLDKVMAEMRSLAKLGQLRRPQLNTVVQQLNSLLQTGAAKKHGIQQAQDILNRVRQTDRVLKQVALHYTRLQADVLSKLGGGVGGRSKRALTAINKLKI